MRCIGDPFGVGADCIHSSTGFVYGAIPDPDTRGPIIVMVPTCDMHAALVADWVMQNNPSGEAWGYPWEYFDVIRDRTIAEVGDVFVYTPAA